MRTAAILTMLALLAACNDAADPAPQASASPTAGPAPVTADAPATAATKDAAPPPAATLFAGGVIVRRQEPVRLLFGQPRQAVLKRAGTQLGKPELSRNDECGAGPMEFAEFGDLTLNFVDGAFVGWIAQDQAALVTVDGVRLGNTLADIKRERTAALVSDSTLDGEFEYTSGDSGTIGGFVDGSGDAARVTALYAGLNCFFR